MGGFDMLRPWCERAAWVAAACCLSTGFVEPATPCAPAPPPNKRVDIADESAIIVWDADTKTEHFIRRASFKSDAADFGFLVPTPTKPDLAEADDAAFENLAKFTAPEIVEKTRPAASGCDVPIGCSSDKKAPAKSDGAKPEVRVLEEKRVAGFDAAVLEADTADVLADWLNKNGYHFSPALTEWAAHYIKLKWKITAFKIAKKAAGEEVATSSVRMSFRADAPFYPYLEPKVDGKTAVGRRFLRVFVLAPQRVRGALGDESTKWPGTTAWAGPMGTVDRGKLFEQLKLPVGTGGPIVWLTEFEDPSSPRPGHADVTFVPAPEQEPVKREPHIRYVSTSRPSEVLAWYAPFACLLLVLGLSRRGDKRAGAGA